MPGFYHLKGEPYLVRIIEASGKRYSRDEVLKAFPPVEQEPRSVSSFVSIPILATDEDTLRIKNALEAD